MLKSIQTQVEWRKVFCHMTLDGSVITGGGNEFEITAQQEQSLVRFLMEGINRDKEFHQAKRELAIIYGRLKETSSWGYALAMNDTIYYNINRISNPYYPQRYMFGPCKKSFIQMA